MKDYQELVNEEAEKARKSPYYWASRVSDQFLDKMWDVMESENISQSELARRSGVSRQRISKMFNGYGNFTIETMQTIAVALGYKIDQFIISPLTSVVSYSAPKVEVSISWNGNFVEHDADRFMEKSQVLFEASYASNDAYYELEEKSIA